MSEYLINHFTKFSIVVVDCILAFMSILSITFYFCILVPINKAFIDFILNLATYSILYLVPFSTIVAILGFILELRKQEDDEL